MAYAGTRLDRLAQFYLGGGKADERALIRQGIAELDELYPHLAGGSHPYHYVIVEALALADTNGGRIPMDTPYLGETLEALAIRDASVTLPPQPADDATPAPLPASAPIPPQPAPSTPRRKPQPACGFDPPDPIDDSEPDDWTWHVGEAMSDEAHAAAIRAKLTPQQQADSDYDVRRRRYEFMMKGTR